MLKGMNFLSPSVISQMKARLSLFTGQVGWCVSDKVLSGLGQSPERSGKESFSLPYVSFRWLSFLEVQFLTKRVRIFKIKHFDTFLFVHASVHMLLCTSTSVKEND